MAKGTKEDKKEQLRTIKNKEKMIDALIQSHGVVTPACKAVGISRNTYYQYLKDDEEFAEACEEVCTEVSLDFVESKHYENIEKGKEKSIIYHLKTKGAKRGYIERKLIGEDPENRFTKVSDFFKKSQEILKKQHEHNRKGI